MLKSYWFLLWMCPACLLGLLLAACRGVRPTTITATATSPSSSITVAPTIAIPLPTDPPTPVGSAYARVEAVIPVKGIPFGLAVSQDAVWVLQRSQPFSKPGSVLQLDRATNQIVGEPIQLDFDPWSIAATDDSVWVAKNGPAAVAHIDPGTQQIVATVDVDASLVAVDTQAVWVSGAGENADNANTASPVDSTTHHLVGLPVPVGLEPIQMVAGAGSVWVGSHGIGTLTRIDFQTGQILATIDVGFPIHGLTAGPESVWAADYHGNKVVQISSITNQIIGEPIPLPFPPYALAASATDAWVGVSALGNDADPGDDRVVRIDPHTNTIVDTLHVGGQPLAIVIDDAGVLWVALGGPNRIVKIVPQPLPTSTLR